MRQPIDGGDPSMAEPRINVLATCGEGPPDVVLTTHLDTVPPYIPLTEDDEYLYGRGTCDAKGIFAAMWVAAERLRASGHTGVALLGIVGEETDSCGAKNASAILPKARWIIDGEPTEGVMTSAAKGVLAMKVRAKGVAGHSAYPERGHSAVHDLVSHLAKLLATSLPFEDDFGPTTVNIGHLAGGVAANVIAPSAEATLMVRVGTDLATVRAAVESHLPEGVEVEVLSASDPLRIHVPQGYDSAPVSFGSDVPHLSPIGTPLLVGPGSIHDAHTKGEKIGKQALRDAVDLYEQLALRLMAQEVG